jgi:hypothetical protein
VPAAAATGCGRLAGQEEERTREREREREGNNSSVAYLYEGAESR